MKGNGAIVQAPVMRKSVSEGLPSQSGSVYGEEDQAETITLVSPEPGPPAARSNLPAPWARPSGRSERIFFEDVIRFEKEILSSSRTSLSLGLASAEVRSIAVREKMQIDALSLFTKDRQPLMEKLAARLDAEAAMLFESEVGPGPETRESNKSVGSSKNADSDKDNRTEVGNVERKGTDEAGADGGEEETME